jgi:vacuolar-type H+-ATPase subunit I/STV1
METLIINIPDKKSALVKQILKGLGVTIKSETKDQMKPSDYAKSINISKEDAKKMLHDISESRNEWERDI